MLFMETPTSTCYTVPPLEKVCPNNFDNCLTHNKLSLQDNKQLDTYALQNQFPQQNTVYLQYSQRYPSDYKVKTDTPSNTLAISNHN